MFQSVQRRCLSFMILIYSLHLLCFPTAVLAEVSVYDTYQPSTTKDEHVNHIDGDDSIGPPSEQVGQLMGTSTNKESVFVLFLKILFYLIIILVMIYGLIKFLAAKQNKLGQQQLFQPIGGTALGSNKSLQLVKFGQTYFLLGVAEQISLIKEITDPEEIAQLEEDLEKQESRLTKGFSQWIRSKDNAGVSKTDSFQHMLANSLEKQKQKRGSIERKWSMNMSKDEQKEDTLG